MCPARLIAILDDSTRIFRDSRGRLRKESRGFRFLVPLNEDDKDQLIAQTRTTINSHRHTKNGR